MTHGFWMIHTHPYTLNAAMCSVPCSSLGAILIDCAWGKHSTRQSETSQCCPVLSVLVKWWEHNIRYTIHVLYTIIHKVSLNIEYPKSIQIPWCYHQCPHVSPLNSGLYIAHVWTDPLNCHHWMSLAFNFRMGIRHVSMSRFNFYMEWIRIADTGT